MSNKNLILAVLTGMVLILPTPSRAADVSQDFNFDGNLLDTSNNPIAGPVTVRFQIYDPGAACLLFEGDIASVNPDAVTGYISLKIGSAGRTVNDPGLALRNIFQNGALVRSSGTGCPGGYTSAAAESRKLRVIVAGTTLTPDYVIASVPMATVAESLQGKIPSDFMAANSNYSFPAADGSANQVLKTDGVGNVTWSTPSAGGITSLNGSSSSSQSFSTGFGGTAPAFSTAGSVHSLNIPMASVGSVGAGLISNAEYNSFNNKMDASGATMTGALILSGAPTISMHAATKGYVDSKVLASGTGIGNTMRWDGANWVDSNALIISGSGTVSVTPSHSVTSGDDVADKDYVDTVAATSGDISDVTAGNGLSGGGSSGSLNIDLNVDNVGVEVTADTLSLKNGGVTLSKLANGAVNGQVMEWNSVASAWQLSNSTAPANGQVLTWDSSLNAGLGGWKPATVGGGAVTSVEGATGTIDLINSVISGTDSGPTWSQSGSNITLNIPLASNAATTGGGLITKAQYDTFNTKLSSGLNSGYILVGDVSNNAVGVSMSGDASIVNTGAVTIAPGAITSAKILDGTVSTADLAGASVTSAKLASLSVTDAAVNDVGVNKIISGAGKYLTYAPNGGVCANGDMMKWNGALPGWDCSGAIPFFNKTGDTMSGSMGIIPGSAGAPGLYLNGTTSGISSSGGSALDLVAGGASRLTVLPSGNVGIGNTAPAAKLDVSGNANINGTLNISAGINSNGPSTFTGSTTLGGAGTAIVSVNNYNNATAGTYTTATNIAVGATTVTTVSGLGAISPGQNLSVSCHPTSSPTQPILHSCYVSGAGIVTIALQNVGAAVITTPPTNWNITITKF